MITAKDMKLMKTKMRDDAMTIEIPKFEENETDKAMAKTREQFKEHREKSAGGLPESFRNYSGYVRGNLEKSINEMRERNKNLFKNEPAKTGLNIGQDIFETKKKEIDYYGKPKPRDII